MHGLHCSYNSHVAYIISSTRSAGSSADSSWCQTNNIVDTNFSLVFITLLRLARSPSPSPLKVAIAVATQARHRRCISKSSLSPQHLDHLKKVFRMSPFFSFPFSFLSFLHSSTVGSWLRSLRSFWLRSLDGIGIWLRSVLCYHSLLIPRKRCLDLTSVVPLPLYT